MNLKYAIFLGIATLSAASCSSNNNRTPPVSEIFTPVITSEDVKEFNYEIVLQAPPGGGPGAGGRRSPGAGSGGFPGAAGGPGAGGGRGPGSNRGGGDPLSEIDVDQIVANAMEELEYCREGYEEIERIEGRARITYRGRCLEPASDSDRANYETLVTQPVPTS